MVMDISTPNQPIYCVTFPEEKNTLTNLIETSKKVTRQIDFLSQSYGYL